MTSLNDKQTAILANAAGRRDGQLLPLPDDVKLKGGALAAVLRALERRNFVRCSADDTWVITDAGCAAVNVKGPPPVIESKDDNTASEAAPAEPDTDDATPMPLFRPGTRQAQILELLQRDQGADIDEIVLRTGWQSHSVRAVLTGFRKRGIEVTRAKEGNGISVYRATWPDRAGRVSA